MVEELEVRSLLAGLGLVADDATDRVTVFEPDTFAVLGNVVLPGGPAIGDVVILGNGSKGFVTDFNDRVFPIDLTTPNAPVLGAAIPIANPGEDISITPDQNFLVVSDGSAVVPLSVIQVSTLTQIGTFATGADSNSVDVTSNGSVLVTSITGTVRRLTIDGAGTIVNTGEFMASEGDPNNVYSSPNGNFGVVVTRSAGTIRSFTVAGMMPVDTRSIDGFGIAGAFSPAGDRFYVRTQSAVQAYAFNSATGALGAVPIFSIPISSSPDYFGIDQVAVSPDGSKLYVPQPGSVKVFSTAGGALLSTIVSEGNIGAPTGIAVQALNVVDVNDAPSGADATVTTAEDTTYTFTVADFGFSDPNDAPPNSFQAVRITTLPAAGTLTVNGAPATAGQFVPVFSIASGQLQFTPAPNADGLPYSNFAFQVKDNGGTANGGVDLDPSPNTLTINVSPINDAPSGADATVTTAEDTAYTFTVADFGFSDPNDAPPNNFAAVRLTTLPAAGTLTVSGMPALAGQVVPISSILSGQVQFAPAANANGLPYASFAFQVQDDGGTANGGVDLDPSPNTLTINVTPVNDAPVAEDDSYATSQGTPLTVPAPGVLENDSDVDGDSLSAALATGPSHGAVDLNPDGSFTYTPDSTFSGADTFTYTVSDGNGGTDTATVSIDVAAAAPGSVVTITDSCLGGTALLITGTSDNDLILVIPGLDGTLTVIVNGVIHSAAAPSGRVIAIGGWGNDAMIMIAVSQPVWLYGEDGNDVLIAGSGGSLLIGGSGNDLLLGGSGRDIMIGGEGADLLVANGNDDILVAGLTNFDSRSTAGHEEFWCDVWSEWTSANSFAARVQNLRDGSGGDAHNNGSFLLPNVVDDLMAGSIDALFGGAGSDWLLFEAGEDIVAGAAEATN